MPVQVTRTDARDGHVYTFRLMPDGRWWSDNLAYASATSKDYNNDPANRPTYGRLYLWADAVANAMSGAHIATQTEWQDLVSKAGGDTVAGGYLKSSTLFNGTDLWGFSALPGGFSTGPNFYDLANAGYWWTSTNVAGTANLWSLSIAYDSASQGTALVATGYLFSARMVLDSWPSEVSPFTFLGAPFSGFERGFSVKLNRQIDFVDTIGGTIRGIPKAPAIYDEWEVDTELWVNASQAQILETVVPPYGVPVEQSIRVPTRSGDPTFAGLLPNSSTGVTDTYLYPEVRAFTSMGRKGVRMDLYGYKITFALRCFSDGTATNPQTSAPTTTVPTWLSKKFASHQVQDWSNQSVATFSASNGASTDFRPVKHGRRTDINFNLDHLTVTQASQLVQFFRGVRHNSVTINVDNGPNGVQAVAVYLKGLSLQRGAGLWWDGSLEMVLA